MSLSPQDKAAPLDLGAISWTAIFATTGGLGAPRDRRLVDVFKLRSITPDVVDGHEHPSSHGLLSSNDDTLSCKEINSLELDEKNVDVVNSPS
jgi:hypothetical protein